MKKLLSYLITLIVGLIGGIYCHDKVQDTVVGWLDKRTEKRQEKRRRNTPYLNFKYTARPWNYSGAPYDYKDMWFDERADAEKVLLQMQTETNKDVATIADLKKFSGLCANWIDYQYYWTDLSKAEIFKGRNGKYYLDLPEPISFDDREDTNVSI